MSRSNATSVSTPEVDTVTRSYKLKVARELNGVKRDALEAMDLEWQRTAKSAYRWFWAGFWKTGRFDTRLACSGHSSTFPRTKLVTSQKQLIYRGLVGQAASWTSNLKRRGRKLGNAIADEALRHEVLWINFHKLWHAPNADHNRVLVQGKGPERISIAATRIARRWFSSHIRRFKLPNPEGLPLQVNVNSARFESATNTTHAHFQYWATVCSLQRGKTLALPIEPHAYFAAAPGEVAQTMTFLRRGEDRYLMLTRARPVESWTLPGVDTLAIDLGLRNLLATSEGDIRGQNFIDGLRRYDRQLLKLHAGLQAAGIVRLAQCKRYRRLVERIRGFVKNNVQRAVREVLELRRPTKVILERLNFTEKDSGLGKRMNRLLRNFGQAAFKQTLKAWSELKGFEIVEVAAAYTSQICSKCGFVHAANRSSNSFGCLSCGYQAHADVNAAKNLRGRSAQDATPTPGNHHHEWRVLALRDWLARLRAGLLKALPGSSQHSRLVRRACAGATALMKEKRDQKASLELLHGALGWPECRLGCLLHKTIMQLMHPSPTSVGVGASTN